MGGGGQLKLQNADCTCRISSKELEAGLFLVLPWLPQVLRHSNQSPYLCDNAIGHCGADSRAQHIHVALAVALQQSNTPNRKVSKRG